MMQSDLATLLITRAKSAPNRQIYSFLDTKGKEQSVTYQQLLHSSQEIAARLVSITSPEHIIVLSFRPSLIFIEMVYGCILAGRTFMPVYPMYSEHDIERTKKLVENIPDVLIVMDHTLDKAESETFDLPLISYRELLAIEPIKRDYRVAETKNNDTVFLQPSAGTTRLPKSVMVTKQSLMNCLFNMKVALNLTSDDIGCSWLPPFNDMGLIGAIFLPLYVDFTIYLMRSSSFVLDPLSWISMLSERKVTITAAPNWAYDICCYHYKNQKSFDCDLSNLRLAINSAEMIRAKTILNFYEIFKPHGLKWESLFTVYGLAEATLMVSANSLGEGPYIGSFNRDLLHDGIVEHCDADDRNRIDLVASGKCIDSMNCLIVDECQSQCKCSFQVGEILVRGNSLTLGYFKETETTESVYISSNLENENIQYVKTGDIGFMDDQGYLFVIGRAKDAVKSSCSVVCAEEIEAIVSDTLKLEPNCATSAVFISDTDISKLVIIQEIPNHCIKYNDYVEQIEGAIGPIFSISLDKIIFVSIGEIPRTTSGKIKRHAALVLHNFDLLEPKYVHSFS